MTFCAKKIVVQCKKKKRIIFFFWKKSWLTFTFCNEKKSTMIFDNKTDILSRSKITFSFWKIMVHCCFWCGKFVEFALLKFEPTILRIFQDFSGIFTSEPRNFSEFVEFSRKFLKNSENSWFKSENSTKFLEKSWKILGNFSWKILRNFLENSRKFLKSCENSFFCKKF